MMKSIVRVEFTLQEAQCLACAAGNSVDDQDDALALFADRKAKVAACYSALDKLIRATQAAQEGKVR
jgi:hypothetical protein